MDITKRGAEMKKIRIGRNAILLLLTICFMSLGSLGTVALANYSNVIVEASIVNVRLGPGLTYDIMTQVHGGTVVNVLSERNEWYKVRLDDNRIGWIASWLIDNTEVAASQNLIATITESSVNIRAENNREAEIIGSADQGESFNLLYEENGWSQIYFHDRIAWVLSDLVNIEPGSLPGEEVVVENDTVTTEVAELQKLSIMFDNVNIRSGPSLDYDIVHSASAGETYDFIGFVDDFIELQFAENQTAFVANWLAEVEDLEPSIPQSTTTLSEATIVIDPGHGGVDPGAVGDNLYEKQATMETSLAIADRLRAEGANVILTRSEDASISLEERAWLSNSYHADLFISIHYDSTLEGVYRTGTTTYYYADQDLAIAELVNRKLANNLPLDNNGTAFGNYLVLRENTQPSLLLELGYMNNNSDVETFNTLYYQNLVADSIYEALAEYFQ